MDCAREIAHCSQESITCARGFALVFERIDEVLDGSRKVIRVVPRIDNSTGGLDLGFEGFQEFGRVKLESVFVGHPEKHFFRIVVDDAYLLKFEIAAVGRRKPELAGIFAEGFAREVERLLRRVGREDVFGRACRGAKMRHVFVLLEISHLAGVGAGGAAGGAVVIPFVTAIFR